MSKRFLVVILVLLLAGCTKQKVLPVDNGPESTVKTYITGASCASWDVVKSVLSGEALQETMQNVKCIKSTEKIVSVETRDISQVGNTAFVYAEVIKTAEYMGNKYDDLAAYKFKLQKLAGQWKIYKVMPADIMQPALKPETLPTGAGEDLEAYIELPIKDKRDKAYLYLAGPALYNSLKYAGNSLKEPQLNPECRVTRITPVGVSDRYIITQVEYWVEMPGYKPTNITAVADMVNISGVWKIINLDIANADRGEE